MRGIIASCVLVSVVMFGCAVSPEETAVPVTTTGEAASEGIANWSVQLIREYLSDKPWGFFGASCEQWLEIDYLIEEPSAFIKSDGRIHVEFTRHPDRMLGPDVVKFDVDLDSAHVEGDHADDDERLGTTEGCDKW